MHEWLAGLKVGDAVIAVSDYARRRAVQKVTHTTATQIHVESTKYRRKNGVRVGSDSWYRQFLSEATPEAVAEVRLERRYDDMARSIVRAGESMQGKNRLPLTGNDLDVLGGALEAMNTVLNRGTA